ncbi:hypothetical protein WJX72_011708 [[Myrmecia] bisecta]|uniref:Uncharacterized protein n=1 Tax=[Myrmecia] bisecta TaxID=41462 RepID=A0AAW1P9G9_9CHLO
MSGSCQAEVAQRAPNKAQTGASYQQEPVRQAHKPQEATFTVWRTTDNSGCTSNVNIARSTAGATTIQAGGSAAYGHRACNIAQAALTWHATAARTAELSVSKGRLVLMHPVLQTSKVTWDIADKALWAATSASASCFGGRLFSKVELGSDIKRTSHLKFDFTMQQKAARDHAPWAATLSHATSTGPSLTITWGDRDKFHDAAVYGPARAMLMLTATLQGQIRKSSIHADWMCEL